VNRVWHRLAFGAWFAAAGCALAAGGAALGLPPHAAPPAAQAELGRQLFFDRGLSVNGTLSCAMCHVPAQGFTVNELRTSVGMEGVSLRRNAPTLLNVGWVERLFVDGRAASLEVQALQPLVHPDEMANASLAAVMARIARMPAYRAGLQRAFGDARATPARIAKALAAYQRTLVAGGAPFDRWRWGGEPGALDATAQRGYTLFVERGCVQCHTLGERHALFSDGAFHNVGVQARSEALRERPVAVTLIPGLDTEVTPETLRRIGVPDAPDLGRQEVTGRAADARAFRTPSLRNVALTAPYMHDGSLATLDEVLDHYAAGGMPQDSAQDARIRPFVLTPPDRAALLAFLHALTSPAAAAP
jgi:cytochrome c peroxidase